jgi:ABC-type uncharacterized transport system substrate-binding protein
VLGNAGSSNFEASTKSAQEAAGRIGGTIEVFLAATPQEIDAIFARLAEKRVDAVTMTPNQLFLNRRVQLATASARYLMPVIFYDREYAVAGGLMSYGANTGELYRQVGIYVGRILKGEKPSELPVMQPTKLELVINLETPARDRGPADGPGHRRRRDRIGLFAALHEGRYWPLATQTYLGSHVGYRGPCRIVANDPNTKS